MRGQRWTTWIVGGVILAAALGLALSPESEPSAPGQESGAAAGTAEAGIVEVDTVERARSVEALTVPGVLRASRRGSLGFTVPGRLAERPVQVGDRVRRGQVLARLEAGEFRHAAASAEAAVREAEARERQLDQERGRVEALFRDGAATREELEEARAAAEAWSAGSSGAATRRAEAERRLGETTLRAPWDGVVGEVLLEPGEWAAPGVPVVEVHGQGDLEVEVGVPERALAALAGAEVPVSVRPSLLGGAGRSPWPGRVLSAGRAAAGSGSLFPVVVAVDADPDAGTAAEILPGMAVEVTFELPAPPSVVVPFPALLNPGGRRPAVFRVVPGDGVNGAGDGLRVERVPVEPLAVQAAVETPGSERATGAVGVAGAAGAVVVRGDLKPGDRVVVAGHGGLADGSPVRLGGGAPRPTGAGAGGAP